MNSLMYSAIDDDATERKSADSFGQINSSNSPGSQNSQKAYFVKFSVMFGVVFCSTLIFCIFFVMSSEGRVSSIISSYLKNPFASSVYFRDFVSVIFDTSSPDMFQLLIILILGFTFFSTTSCSAVVIYRAFSLGICVSYLSSFLLTRNSSGGQIAMAWIFAASHILISLCICMFAAAACSLQKKIKANMPALPRKKTIKKVAKSAASHMVKFFALGGQIILIRTIQLVLYALIYG